MVHYLTIIYIIYVYIYIAKTTKILKCIKTLFTVKTSKNIYNVSLYRLFTIIFYWSKATFMVFTITLIKRVNIFQSMETDDRGSRVLLDTWSSRVVGPLSFWVLYSRVSNRKGGRNKRGGWQKHSNYKFHLLDVCLRKRLDQGRNVLLL